MPVNCPRCGEDDNLTSTALDDGRRQLTCGACGETWQRGEAEPVFRTIDPRADARSAFERGAVTPERTSERIAALKARFLREHPYADELTDEFRARYKLAFSRERLRALTIDDIRKFGNSRLAGYPGNMSRFNASLRELGDEEATRRIRGAIDYLLYSEAPSLEDRLTDLITARNDDLSVPGFREALLTKVLAMTLQERFLPLTKYTGSVGKREMAKWVFDMELPAPDAAGSTIGRLIVWSNDLLRSAAGAEGFENTEHLVRFLWAEKEQALNAAGLEMAEPSEDED